MATNQSKIETNPSQKPQKTFVSIQVFLRSIAFATSLIASVLTATNKQVVNMYDTGFNEEANFKWSPSFGLLVAGTAVASFYSLVSVPLVFILNSKRSSFHILV